MKLFDLLKTLASGLEPELAKVHLATWNGRDDPLEVYLQGKFDEWQRWQTKRNFERSYVVSLISLPKDDHWLFAGLHLSNGAKWDDAEQCYYYELCEDASCGEMNGRLVVKFKRSGRQPYLVAENWSEGLELSEIYAERLTIGEFPGYRSVNLSRGELELIYSQSLDSWRTALSNVAGVYLISDTKTGELYVGAAYGAGGFWQRWSSYVESGHGGNIELRKLLKDFGMDRVEAFRYSILEITDIHDSEESIRAREKHWKDILLSRTHGLNAN